MQHPASPVGVNISSSIYIKLTHTCCTLCTLVYLKEPSRDAGDSKQSWNSTPNPLSPQKGSLVNLSDTLYAMSSMDLRSRYIRKFGRVPLHLNYKLLGRCHLLVHGPSSNSLSDQNETALHETVIFMSDASSKRQTRQVNCTCTVYCYIS
jgi:hypothetical protein